MAETQNALVPAPAARRGIDESAWNALVTSIYPGANENSVLLAWDYCKARGLDPLKKPAHIVPMSIYDTHTREYVWRDVIMPGIYEIRTTAARTGEYAGQDDPIFGPEIKYKNVTAPEWCRVTVYRLVQHKRVPFSHTEFFTEAVTVKKRGQGAGEVNAMWTRRPRGQLAKCAEAGALRKAFPEELGGQMTREEMEGGTIDAGEVERVDTVEEIPMPQAKPAPQSEPKQQEQAAAPEQVAKPEANTNGPKISAGAKKVLKAKMGNHGVDDALVCKQFNLASLDDIAMGQINDVMSWVDKQ